MPAALPATAVVHLDESCLGNGRAGATPGGAGGLIELRTATGLQRRELFLHAADTTNNRMALSGAIAALEWLAREAAPARTLVVSDSEYLVKGMREWVPGWIRRGWRRKSGAIENLALWQTLVAAAGRHRIQWTWVRGHRGHAKNEYADHLAVRAATEQITSAGAVPSEFAAWLEAERARGRYLEYHPDQAFVALEKRIDAGVPSRLAD